MLVFVYSLNDCLFVVFFSLENAISLFKMYILSSGDSDPNWKRYISFQCLLCFYSIQILCLWQVPNEYYFFSEFRLSNVLTIPQQMVSMLTVLTDNYLGRTLKTQTDHIKLCLTQQNNMIGMCSRNPRNCAEDTLCFIFLTSRCPFLFWLLNKCNFLKWFISFVLLNIYAVTAL